MNLRYKTLLLCLLLLAPAFALRAQQAPQAKPQDTEVWTPEPKVVTPGATTGAAPSDAIVLFDGKSLDEWVSTRDKSPAAWTVADGVMTVNKKAGNIETKRRFRNYQLHLEWQIPADIGGEGQSRGNSGLFLASTGGGDAGYELQILDSFNNKTYANGQAGSIYKQAIPLANAMRKPGEWQVYDVVWTAPTFNADGTRQDAGVRDRLPQRRAHPEQLQPEGRDALHRPADVQGVRRRADQAAVARRPEQADQFPEHLAAGALRRGGASGDAPRSAEESADLGRSARTF